MECVPQIPPIFGGNGAPVFESLGEWPPAYYKPSVTPSLRVAPPGVIGATGYDNKPIKSNKVVADLWQALGANGAHATQSTIGSPTNSVSPTPELSSFSRGIALGTSSAVPTGSASISPLASETLSTTSRRRQSTNVGSPSRSRKRTVSESDKQADKLEKNRRAAEKCRQKQRAREKGLQERAHQEELKRAGLVRQVTELQGEILSLKERMVVHSGCEDAKGIRQYLMRDVNKWTAQRQGLACPYDAVQVQTKVTT